jgi:predicted transcriptional regulator
MKSLSLKLPDTLNHRLTHAAASRKSSKSDVVRDALEVFLALSLAKDLAGSVSGPADLSVNPSHLKQFGRVAPRKRKQAP